MKDKWQPIDTAPQTGEEILVYIPLGEFWSITIAHWNWRREGWLSDQEYRLDGTPTHWQPLEPPEL